MKFPGLLLLVSGALIVLCALALLRDAARVLFILLGFATQVTGAVMTALSMRAGAR